MTNQDKKAWLKRYTDLDKAINQKIGEIDTCRALCEKMVAIMTDMPRGGSSSREDGYVRLITLIEEANAEIDRYVDMRAEIIGAIRTVPGITLQTVLCLRYINGLTWEKIAVEMEFTYQWVCKLHGDALEKIVLLDSN